MITPAIQEILDHEEPKFGRWIAPTYLEIRTPLSRLNFEELVDLCVFCQDKFSGIFLSFDLISTCSYLYNNQHLLRILVDIDNMNFEVFCGEVSSKYVLRSYFTLLLVNGCHIPSVDENELDSLRLYLVKLGIATWR
jgi:hypothetical protein